MNISNISQLNGTNSDLKIKFISNAIPIETDVSIEDFKSLLKTISYDDNEKLSNNMTLKAWFYDNGILTSEAHKIKSVQLDGDNVEVDLESFQQDSRTEIERNKIFKSISLSTFGE